MGDVAADFIDDGGGGIVLLPVGGEPFASVEDDCFLAGLALFGFGDGCNKLGAAASFDYVLGWLALMIKLPMPRRVFIGRIENRPFKEIVHWPVGIVYERLRSR
jgi:hypothetical protein